MNQKLFLKALVHPSDPATRDEGVDLCEKWIAQGKHPKAAYLAIWKGLYFCMWHSDKPLVQHELAHKLANFQYFCPTNDQWHHLMSTFWDTMCREWSGIDRLRIDKFYSLLRYFFHESVHILQSKERTEAEYRSFAKILEDGPLGKQAPTGIIYHMVDLFWYELREVLKENFLLNTDLLFPLMSPFYKLMATSEEIITTRIGKSIFTALIQKNIDSIPHETRIKILQQICQELLTYASKRDTLPEQRIILYNIRKKVYKKLFVLQHPDFRPIQNMKDTEDDEDEIQEEDVDKEMADDDSDDEE
jgi:ribosomal RNA-processing protein 1